jgi:hypothetical protein
MRQCVLTCVGLLVVEDLVPGRCHPAVAGQEVPVKIVGEIGPAHLLMGQVDTTMLLDRLHLMGGRTVNRRGECMWGICPMKSNGLN